MGKGSKRRPQLVDNATFAENWERTFLRQWITQTVKATKAMAAQMEQTKS